MFMSVLKGIISRVIGGGGSGGAVVSIEAVELNLMTGTSHTINLTKGQNEAQCVPFIFARQSGDYGGTYDGRYYMLDVEVIDNAGTAAVRISRQVSGNNNYVYGYIVEFNSDISVQQVAFSGYPNATANITAVDLSKAFVMAYAKCTSTTISFKSWLVRAVFNSTTQVGLIREATPNATISGHVYVVEDISGNHFDVQTVDQTYSVAGNNDATLTSVDTATSMVVSSIGMDATYNDVPETWLENGTTLRTYLPLSTSLKVTAFVVTWKDGTSVQHVHDSKTTGTASAVVTTNKTITSVDLTKSIAFPVWRCTRMFTHRTDNDTTWSLPETIHVAKLSDATTLSLPYWDAAFSRTVSGRFEVVEFAFAGGTSTLKNGMVSWWTMDEASGDRADVHGGFTLVDISSVGSIADSKPSGQLSADFERSSSDAMISSDTVTNIGWTVGGDMDFTIAGWFKLESLPPSNDGMYLLNRNTTSGSNNNHFDWYAIMWNSGGVVGIYFATRTGSTSYNAALSVGDGLTLTTGVWYHYIGWHDAANNELNLEIREPDGTLYSANTTGVGIPNATSTAYLQFGRQGYSYTRYFDGYACNWGVWERTLTLTERLELFDNGAGLNYDDIGGPVSIYLWDTFTDTDDTLLENHTPDIDSVGTGWQTVPGKSQLKISSNKAYSYLVQNEGRNTIDIGQEDFLLTVDTVNSAVNYGHSVIYPKYVDENNWVRVARINTVGHEVKKKVAGTETTLHSDTVWPDASLVKMKVLYEGDTITAWFNNVEFYSGDITDSVFNGVTTFALYNFDVGNTYDNLLVVPHSDFLGFQPTDITGCVLWLDAADRGITTNQWDDKSGQGNHFTAANASYFPSFAGGEASFDGVDDRLTGPNFLSALTDGEMFIVQKRYLDQSTTGNNTGWFDLGSSTELSHFAYLNQIYCEFGTTLRKACGDPTPDISVYHTYNIWSAPNDWQLNIDGANQFSTVVNTVGFPTTPVIGWSNSSYRFQGEIKAVIIFDHKLSSVERAQVELYCAGL